MDKNKSSYSTVVEYLNAAMMSNCEVKLENLYKIKELIIHKEPALLGIFLPNVLDFHTDRNVEIRKFIISFMEEVLNADVSLLTQLMPVLLMLLSDNSLQVLKKCIQGASMLYKKVIQWLAKYQNDISEEVATNVLSSLASFKTTILGMVEHENDGVRTFVIKFMESVVLLQTIPDNDSRNEGGNLSLHDVAAINKFTQKGSIEEEATNILDILTKFHMSSKMSSVSLMTCMDALATIASTRPQFSDIIVAALVSMLDNLPYHSSITPSQMNSVRKCLKLQLLNLTKRLLSDTSKQILYSALEKLGGPVPEMQRNIWQNDKRQANSNITPKPIPIPTLKTSSQTTLTTVIPSLPVQSKDEDKRSKRTKRPIDVAEISEVKRPRADDFAVDSGTDVTEEWIFDKLNNIEVVADIVCQTLSNLPSKMPAEFGLTYTSVESPGSMMHIRLLSSLLASQMKIPNEETKVKASVIVEDEVEEVKEIKPKIFIPNIRKPFPKTAPSLRHAEIAKPLQDSKRDKFAIDAVGRILNSEKIAIVGGAMQHRMKIITSIATTFGLSVRQAILEHILADLKNRLDLALGWLFEEYSILQGFYKLPNILQHNQKPDHNYNTLLCSIALTIIQKNETRDKEELLSRLYLQAPLITDNALDILRELSNQDNNTMNLLKDLILKRPTKQLLYLNILLEKACHRSPTVNEVALKHVFEFHGKDDFKAVIEDYARFFLGFLKLSSPPAVLFGADKGLPIVSTTWTEEVSKVCMQLYLTILPSNPTLIFELSKIYAATNSDVKRVLLKQFDIYAKGLTMSSQQLVELVDTFPPGAETLVTRVLHTITDKKTLSQDVVLKVKEQYEAKSLDVRFLIPVINGLPKSDVIQCLPTLLRLNPHVVKEVFNRLLGIQSDGQNLVITPAELLIALHTIEPSQCDIKHVIKATAICFAEKSVFTQEVLAIVIQNLMELNPLPTLLMRTVIQALTFFPRLIGFGMNILQRLILMQVWKNKKVWEGFVKCCQRTKPQSFQVLLQLPSEQLEDVFKMCPDLRLPLSHHVSMLTDSQRAHIPHSVMEAIRGIRRDNISSSYSNYNVKNEPMSPPELTIDI